MYWPIGAPNVYALSKHAIPTSQLVRSNDGLNGDSKSGDSHGSVSSNDKSASDASSASSSAEEAADTTAQEIMPELNEHEILDAKVSRGGSIFVTMTQSALMIWQTKPTVALAGVVRSAQSLKAYGPNTSLLLRPDALIIVVQTTLGYLIAYSLATDPAARVYQTVLPETNRHLRRPSTEGYGNLRRQSIAPAGTSAGEGNGIREVNLRFRMVIRIDAGISRALSLDDELVVATQKPAALQCIKWVAEAGESQTSTELVGRMPWIGRKVTVVDMVYDRPMNLATWITSDGRAYAVQRRNDTNTDAENSKSLFQGFCFREPETSDTASVRAAINARFSLLAVGCANGQIDVYVVKDYTGNIPLSHKVRLPAETTTLGQLTVLSYSPDGYCLFGGYERGWALWTVYGKLCASSFGADRSQALATNEHWVCNVRNAFWAGGGSELALLPHADNRLWFINMARNAATGCFSPANLARGLLHTSSDVIIYRGHEVEDVTALPSDLPLWQTVQIPALYLIHQWPIKLAVVSPDGKYIAVAGRRGLAHYSVASGRWKTFDDPQAEQEFVVRGGMCWYQHILIAAVEATGRSEIRLFSRDKALEYSQIQHIEQLSAPAISANLNGTDSLLVYTYDNTLLHYIIVMTDSSAKLVQVGQIGFHGIIRAPQRVRSISWILPEAQMENGDPAQDVATASVLFLVDGKLVLLQPSTNELGELKYDMRVIAQHVEYYMLLRDQPSITTSLESGSMVRKATLNGSPFNDHIGHSLRDSLWFFDGSGLSLWSDINDVLACAPAELGRDIPQPVAVPLDFCPLAILMTKGIIAGVDADLTQRRDINFSFFRHTGRTQLFLPQLLRYHLAEFNSPAALHLSSTYQDLPYFSHALEILLHDVLDMEVDSPPSPPETALLPTVLSFLSSFNCYLDVVVGCTRKTELRSWQTLFSYLPPVLELFEQSLAQGKLNTAAGYLLVLHAFEQDSFQVHEFALLLRRAAGEQDWDLCKELARFLMGIDTSGATLTAALTEAHLQPIGHSAFGSVNVALGGVDGSDRGSTLKSEKPAGSTTNGATSRAADYFSMPRGDSGEEDRPYATPQG